MTARRVLLLILVLCGNPGCLMFASYAIAASHTPTRNVTNRPEYWGGYIIGQEYELVEDCFIADRGPYSNGVGLAPGKEYDGPIRQDRYWGKEVAIAEYRADPTTLPYVDGVAAAGTRIRCTLVRFNRGLVMNIDDIQIFGTVLDGPWAGTRVDLRELSTYYTRNPGGDREDWRETPVPELLRPVTNTPDTETNTNGGDDAAGR